MAGRLVVVTSNKAVFQGKGFSCETGGTWTKEKESHLEHIALYQQ